MRTLILLLAGLVLAWPAWSAEAPAPRRWLGGDCGVMVWPDSRFSAADRAKQAPAGGLNWVVLCNGIEAGASADPDAGLALAELRTKELTPIVGFQWHAPALVSEDIICFGVDPELPLPKSQVQDVIDWTNAQGGVAVLAGSDRKLERRTEDLTGFAAFEAFHAGKWSPDCQQGGAWDRLLARGRRIGIVGGSAEPTRPVLGSGAVVTYVFAAEPSEDAVVAAIRAGHVYVAERGRIRLAFTVDGSPPGSTVVPENGAVEVGIDVRADEDVDEVKIIGNVAIHGGEDVQDRILVLHSFRPAAKEAARTFKLKLDPGTRYIRAEAVILNGGCRTLTNAVFLGEEAPPPLPPGVRAKHSDLAQVAINNIDWSDKPKATSTIAQLLANRDVGPGIAVHLARTFGKDQMTRVRPLLGSNLSVARAFAAYVLVQVEGEAALERLLPLLQDDNSEPRIYAARMLARFAKPDHAALALRTARDAWPAVRQYGLAALARIPSKDSLVQFRQSLSDRRPEVKRAAELQLCRMLGVADAQRAEFLDGFRAGTLTARQIDAAVTRADLRDLVAAALAIPVEPVTPATVDNGKFRVVVAVAAAGHPEIDGRGDDKAWSQAAAVTSFVTPKGQPAAQQTAVRAVYDEDALYLLFVCVEPNPGQILAKEKEPDGNVWLDDSIDIYVCPAADRKDAAPRYYRLSANTLATKFEEEGRSRHWNERWNAAASVGRDGWTLEIAIPFRSLRVDPPAKGKTRWLVNFVRHRRVAPAEESSFALGDLRTPGQYAELRFE